MEFDWSERTVGDWRELLKEAPRANFLQSWPFAKAVRALDYRPTKLALIKKKNETIGLMAVQEIKIGPVSIVNLYRGPLWFTEEPPEAWLAEFATAFDKEFPKRLFRKRRWMPEWHDDKKAAKILSKTGFAPKEKKTYQTIWLDLSEDEEVIRKSLKQKWRNALNKGERSGLKVHADWKGVTNQLFLNEYLYHKAEKRFRGPSAKFIKEEMAAARPFKDSVILWATKDKVSYAAVLVFIHGNSATYHAGWSNDKGRKCNAHNVLLWEAVKTLKEKGITSFDLGWIEPDNAEGLTKFKRGMGGEEVKLMGVWG